MVTTAEANEPAFTMAMTIAKRHHALMSSTAAMVRARIPRRVFDNFLSCTMRANTGKAVMLIEIPINRPKAMNGKSFGPWLWYK